MNISVCRIFYKKIQPELLQGEVTAEKISDEVLKICANREKVIADLKSACAKLGEPGAAERIAKKILQVAESN